MNRVCGLIGRRGVWIAGPGKVMFSGHVNGYGEGSQFAMCFGDRWYGWWSEHGWAVKAQQPLKIVFGNGQEFELPIGDDGTAHVTFREDA